MKNKKGKISLRDMLNVKKEKIVLPGYLTYPVGEDTYRMLKEENNIDPEDISKTKELIDSDKVVENYRKDFNEESGKYLDIPGSELDDKQEDVGSEDEENNYYSIGGDDHNDLEEENDE
jgi:hypothetical protein